MKNNILRNLLLFAGICLGIFLISVLLGKNNTVSKKDKKLQVTASFYPLYFFSTQIAGEYADVYNITPAGAEPHDYEPTARDMALIEKADLVIVNGAKFESWAERLKDTLKNKLIITGEKLADQQLVEDSHSRPDPHVWLSPILAKEIINIISKGLIQADPQNQIQYEKNTQILLSQMENLHSTYVKGLSICNKNVFVTSHAAFAYLATTYNLQQISISGISPEEEPSTKQLAQTADLIKSKHIKYIFFESLVSPKLSQTLAQEINAQTLTLDPIEGIPEKQMQLGENYFTIMKTNLTNLRTALECK